MTYFLNFTFTKLHTIDNLRGAKVFYPPLGSSGAAPPEQLRARSLAPALAAHCCGKHLAFPPSPPSSTFWRRFKFIFLYEPILFRPRLCTSRPHLLARSFAWSWPLRCFSGFLCPDIAAAAPCTACGSGVVTCYAPLVVPLTANHTILRNISI